MKWGVLVAVVVAFPVPTSAEKELSAREYRERGWVYMEMRPVMEALGASLEWDAKQRTITVTYRDHYSRWSVDSPGLYVKTTSSAGVTEGQEVGSAPLRVIGNRAYVPLHMLWPALGAQEVWHASYVELTAPGPVKVVVRLAGRAPSPGIGVMWPGTRERQLTEADLKGWSNWELTLIRNEIYARHGRPFRNRALHAHFMHTGWYRPDRSFREEWVTGLERRNAEFIWDYQVSKLCRPARRPEAGARRRGGGRNHRPHAKG